jgi:hypothetical protein
VERNHKRHGKTGLLRSFQDQQYQLHDHFTLISPLDQKVIAVRDIVDHLMIGSGTVQSAILMINMIPLKLSNDKSHNFQQSWRKCLHQYESRRMHGEAAKQRMTFLLPLSVTKQSNAEGLRSAARLFFVDGIMAQTMVP